MKRILLSFAISLGLIFSLTPAAFAADTQPPILLDWKLLDKRVDISNGDATARVEFSLSDDSEIDSWVIVLLGSRTSTQTSGLIISKLTSKVGKISTYQATATISFGKAPGEWSWTLYPLKDALGNDSSRFGPGGAWPVTIMVFDKDFTEAKYIADIKAFEEKAAADKVATELKAKQEAEAKAAAELKAKQEADAKAAADKAAADKLLADSNSALAMSQSDLRDANAALVSANAALAGLQTQLSTLNAKMAEMQLQIDSVTAKFTASQKSLTTINAKLKKICAVKPKPKGC